MNDPTFDCVDTMILNSDLTNVVKLDCVDDMIRVGVRINVGVFDCVVDFIGSGVFTNNVLLLCVHEAVYVAFVAADIKNTIPPAGCTDAPVALLNALILSKSPCAVVNEWLVSLAVDDVIVLVRV